jgi:hypothetical protein
MHGLTRRPALATALATAVGFGVASLVSYLALPRRGLFTYGFELYGQRLRAGEVPYRDFSLEYPPGALAPIGLPAFLSPSRYLTAFVVLEVVVGIVLALLLAGALRAAGVSRGARASGLLLLAGAPLLLGPLVLERYDLWPAACVVGALWALLAGRPALGLAALGLGTALKGYPLVVAPLALVYVARRHGRRVAWRSLAALVAVLVVVVGPFLVVAPGGVRHSFVVQGGRGLQLETLGSSLLLVGDRLGLYAAHPTFTSGAFELTGPAAGALATAHTVLVVAVLLALWAGFWRGVGGNRELVAASAAAVAAFAVLDKVLSPQFLLWLVPLVPLLGGRRSVVAATALAVAMILTQLVYPVGYDELVTLHAWPVALLALRNALLLALTVALLVRPRLTFDRERTAG